MPIFKNNFPLNYKCSLALRSKLPTKPPTEYSVNELKDLLRMRQLETTGTKAELITRLTDADPTMWGDTRGNDEHQDLQTPAANVSQINEEIRLRELEILRRERDLLQRELDLLRRSETPISHNSSSSAHVPFPNLKAISDLLNEFSGSANSFETWEKKVELIRDTYQLDENASKMLISSELKGRASSWFHSKPEHLTSSVSELLTEMKLMFDHRPSKLTLRREFENRTWQHNEPFSDYFYDKVILANRVSVTDEEIVDHLVDGIPDPRLRNQARNQKGKKDHALTVAS